MTHGASRQGALAALAVTVAIGSGLTARQGQPPPTFTAGTKTVAVYATVTDARGRLVTDLSREDFTVTDDRKRQEITVFSNDIQPITLVMLLDRSGSMKGNFELEAQAAAAFVRAMGTDDKVRIGSFGKYIQIDPEDFTSDRRTLLKILETELQTEGPTPLWNAVDRGIDKLLLEPGRRAILVFTDGVDNSLDFTGKSKSLKDVMRRAEERDVMVYAIGLSGQNGMTGFGGSARDTGGRGGNPFGGVGRVGGISTGPQLEQPDEGLPKLAAATGGGYFELTSTRDLAATFERVAEELHRQYALGFEPQKSDGKMHELTVSLSRAELTARARKRYLAPRPSAGRP
ncbi:MAG TPA: VWA domain-containing protein [Vicinamibacterales bacterium]